MLKMSGFTHQLAQARDHETIQTKLPCNGKAPPRGPEGPKPGYPKANSPDCLDDVQQNVHHFAVPVVPVFAQAHRTIFAKVEQHQLPSEPQGCQHKGSKAEANRLIESKIQKDCSSTQSKHKTGSKRRMGLWQRQTGCKTVGSQAINTEYKQLCKRQQAGAKGKCKGKSASHQGFSRYLLGSKERKMTGSS